MADFNYARLLATADSLIKRFGDDAVLRHYVDTPDPAGAFLPPIRTQVDTPVRAVFVKASEKMADGTLIHIGDQIALVSGKVDRALLNIIDTIVRGSEVWKVDAIVPLKPGPLNMLYKVKVVQ